MTNREKFKEVFGFMPCYHERNSVCPENFDCDNVPTCRECPFNDKWWDKTYKPCFVMKIEGRKGIKALKKIEEDKR